MPGVSCNAQGPGDLGSVEKAHAFLSQARCVAPVAQPALGSKSWLPLHEQWNERVVRQSHRLPYPSHVLFLVRGRHRTEARLSMT